MKAKALLIGVALGASLAFGTAAIAQEGGPFVDIGYRHGNLRNAQEHIVQAWQLVGTAQFDNDSRLGGHAARAKALLSEANEELRLAADVANEHR
jgi:enoyl-[acyl-carrier-protein] reductase (NADH)